MKMTIQTAAPMTPRMHHRKVLRLASGKRPGTHHRNISGKGRSCVKQAVETCENSDDSGLGFDHPMDVRPLSYDRHNTWIDEMPDLKRRKIDLKLENDETNDNYCFPETLKTCKDNTTIIRTIPNTGIQNLSRASGQTVGSPKTIVRGLPLMSRRGMVPNGPITLTTQLANTSRNGKVQLQIVSQPEQQHRARYQTEGSRGAVKDRTGNSFPIVKLIGYEKPATLQVFIGTDQGRVAPHMFYQACRVSGKNSTPCIEKKIEGTIVIEVELDPTKEMLVTCDCVGILKERNVDVEHRFPEQIGSRNKKKSTRCRMVFRASITNDDGTQEMLQVCSQPIVCTQPPGIPEICKKSLSTSSVNGGMELFILGKNFLKDTRVIFQQTGGVYDSSRENDVVWEDCVVPDKEYLQQTHLVCVVPPYVRQDITEPVTIRLFVVSSGKNSEPHNFIYTPAGGQPVRMDTNPPTPAPFLSKMIWNTGTTPKPDQITMMPPPSLVPVGQRRPSLMDTNSHHSPPMRCMKTEVDDNSQGSVLDMMSEKSNHSLMDEEENVPIPTQFLVAGDLKGIDLHVKLTTAITGVNDLVDTQQPSLETLRKFGVTEPTNLPLPAQTGQSVENFFLTTLENPVNKNVLSNTLAKNDTVEELRQIIPVLNESQMTTELQTALTTQIPTPVGVQTEDNLILSQLSTNLLPATQPTPKLDALVNSTVETHIGTKPISEIRRSPILQPPAIIINATADVLLSTPQPPILPLSTGNDLLVPRTEIPHQEVILNPPSVICTNDNLLGPICSPSINAINHLSLGIKATIANECLVNGLPPIETQITHDILMKNLLIQPTQTEPNTEVKVDEPIRQPCPEMITPAITNMSENDLISYINPSCFEDRFEEDRNKV